MIANEWHTMIEKVNDRDKTLHPNSLSFNCGPIYYVGAYCIIILWVYIIVVPSIMLVHIACLCYKCFMLYVLLKMSIVYKWSPCPIHNVVFLHVYDEIGV
jgi:uncharacterized membrane protein